jgi:5-methylcytosine-specific restriction endonuclease McrA
MYENESELAALWTLDGQWARETQRLERELISLESQIRSLRGRQAELLSALEDLQVDRADGDGGMEAWVSARLDVSSQTSHRLMTAAHHRWVWKPMKHGQWGLDRASHLAKLEAAGAPAAVVEAAASEFSLGRLWGLVEQHQRMSAGAEQATHESRYLVVQPSLDRQMFKLWGQLFGVDGEIVASALDARAESFPPLPEGDTLSRGQLLADALASVCADSLTASGQPPDLAGRAVIAAEVFIDATLAASTEGEAGVTLQSGLRVGPETLTEILCDGKVRVIWTDRNGPMAVSHQTETIPPSIRGFIWKRDQGRCGIEGCRSRNRLQIHHITPRSEGGDHHPTNLILLCWFHHHVAIHLLGYRLDRASPVHRRRLVGARSSRSPPEAVPVPIAS